MTTTLAPRRLQYVADGAETVFAYGCQIYAASDLAVYVDDLQAAIGSDYTVSGVGVESGGAVTFLAPPADGARVTIVSVLPVLQEQTYRENEAFPAAGTEHALDVLNLQIQDTRAMLERVPMLPASTRRTAPLVLPEIVPGQYLIGNLDGDGFVFGDALPPEVATQRPGCQLRRTAVLAVAHNTYTDIPWTLEVVGGGLHSVTTAPERVTVTQAGLYAAVLHVQWATSAVGLRFAAIAFPNGGFIEEVRSAAVDALGRTTVTWQGYVGLGELLVAKVAQTSGGALNLEAGLLTEFAVSWLGPGL